MVLGNSVEEKKKKKKKKPADCQKTACCTSSSWDKRDRENEAINKVNSFHSVPSLFILIISQN